MKLWLKSLFFITLSLMCVFTCVGYAALTGNLRIGGSANISPFLPDIYITSVTPSQSAGVGIELINETYIRLSSYYTVDENGNHIMNSGLTVAQLSSKMTELYKVVNDALIRIDALTQQQ